MKKRIKNSPPAEANAPAETEAIEDVKSKKDVRRAKRERSLLNARPDAGLIKSSLVSLGKNLIYVFVPMGILYLIVLLALILFLSSTLQNIGSTVNATLNLIDATVTDSSASVTEYFEYAFGGIDWNGSFLSVLGKLLDIEWIKETIRGFFDTLSASSEEFDAALDEIIGRFTFNFGKDISVLVSLSCLGLFLSNLFTRVVLRRRNAKRGFKKFLIAHTLVPVVQSLLVAFSCAILYMVRWFALIVLIVIMALWGVVTLVNSWLVHRDGSIRLRDILTAKNVLSFMISCVLIFAVNAAICVLLWLVSPIVSILVTVPFFIYSINVAEVNSDAFVLKCIDARGAIVYSAEYVGRALNE